MISINKQGNAIVIEFTDNDKYLFNGKIEVAPNELIVVVDQSDMVTFKRASNGDVLFSQLVDDIQIAGSPVTKDTVIDQFALIGFTSGGGGGAGGAVSSVNGQTGDVIITPASLNVYTRAEVDDAINAETTERQKQDSALGGMIAAETAAREQAVASKQDTLVSGQNIKTINNQSLLGKGNITVEAGTSNWNDIQGKPEFATVATTGSYNDLSNKPEIPSDYIENITDSDTEFSIDTAFNYKSGKKYSLSFSKTGGFDVIIGGVGDTQRKINLSIDTDIIATKEDLTDYQPVGDYATKAELAGKQDTLVSGTNIKTINGQTLLGEGNIEIQGGSGGISDAPSDNKLYGRKNGNWSEVPSTDNFATKQEISDMLTKSEAASTYQPKGEYLTSIPEEYVTDSELSAKGYATTSQLSSKLDVSTYNSEKANFATKDELNSKADTSAIADMATQTWVQGQGYLTEVPSNYVTDSELTEALADKQDKGNYALKSDLDNLATKEELAAKADASALSAKQDTLVSGTNIKTINGETILGEGDITIQAGGTVDTAMSDTSENAVQNKVIKKYIDDLVGNILTQLQEINGTN